MSSESRSVLPIPPFIGALLRFPASVVHRRIVDGLNSAGFPDFRLPHMAVFQYPGPDGATPGILAQRAGMSKQAMHQLLGSLERLGYLERSTASGDRRLRIVRLTERGRAAWAAIQEVLGTLEREWVGLLGAEDFARLKALLATLWTALQAAR